MKIRQALKIVCSASWRRRTRTIADASDRVSLYFIRAGTESPRIKKFDLIHSNKFDTIKKRMELLDWRLR